MTCLALLACLPVGVRSTAPVAATVVSSLAVVGLGLVGDQDQAGFEVFLAVILLGYSLGAHAEGRPFLAGLACLGVAAPAYQLLTFGSDDSVVDLVINVAFVLVPVGIGLEVRRQRSRAATSARRVTEVEADQQRRTAEAVAEERATIAREMHDIIAHSISVMGVRAAGVRAALPPDLTQERAALQEIEQVGRDSLSEMQLLLGLLRDQGRDDAGAQPAADARPARGARPGLGDRGRPLGHRCPATTAARRGAHCVPARPGGAHERSAPRRRRARDRGARLRARAPRHRRVQPAQARRRGGLRRSRPDRHARADRPSRWHVPRGRRRRRGSSSRRGSRSRDDHHTSWWPTTRR